MKHYRVEVVAALTAASDLVPNLTAEFTDMHGACVFVEKIMELGILKVEISQVTPFDREDGE